MSYFTEIAANLSDPEFELVISDLEDQGEELVTIARCTAIANEADAADDLPDSLTEGVSELSAARQAQVQALWDAFDFDSSGQIDREKLETATVTVGSREAKVFANLKDMDLDGDRVVTQDEMVRAPDAASPPRPRPRLRSTPLCTPCCREARRCRTQRDGIRWGYSPRACELMHRALSCCHH